MDSVTALIVLMVGIACGMWMYSDAKKRGLKQPSVWIWVGLFLNVLGLISYYYWHVSPRSKKA